MNLKALRLLAATLAWLPLAATAALVTWDFRGQIGTVDPGLPPDFTPGTPYQVLVSFDTDAALLMTIPGAGGGSQYRYDPTSLSFRIFIGTTCAPCVPSMEPGFDPAASGIRVRDDFDDPSNFPSPPGPVDGYSFFLSSPSGFAYSLVLRGPVLDIVNGPGLPELPDPRLANLHIASFEVIGPGGAAMIGRISSVNAVAEPGTLALLGLALAGLAARRRHSS